MNASDERLRRQRVKAAAVAIGVAGGATLGLCGVLVWQVAPQGWPAMLGAGLVPGVVGLAALGAARAVWRRQ